MQKIFYLIILLCLLDSCSDPALEMERESMECFTEAAENSKVNLDSLINVVETHLISENQLNGDQGSDYISFLEKMESENKTSHLAEHPSTATFLDLHNLSVFENCKIRFENKAYSGSTSEKLDNAMSDLALSMNITPKSFANAFLNSLNESDFEKPFYKVIFWKTYAGIFISGPEFSTLLPLKVYEEEDPTFDSNYPKATIEITANDTLFWNDKKITVENLKDSITTFIKRSIKNSSKTRDIKDFGTEKVSDYMLYLNAKPNTSYGFYIEVQNIIIKCINDLRNEAALRIYNQEYFSLDEEKSKEIESIIKKTIIEK